MLSIVSSLSRGRGYAFITIILLALCLLVVGIGWHVHADPGSSTADTASGEPDGTGILLALAQTAIHEKRLIAPAGSNAYEFYLSVLQLDPHNRVALKNMQTAFEPACTEVEQSIDTLDLEEARRELDLLRDYDNTNYKLALLGSALLARQAMVTRQHEAEAAAIQARTHDSTSAH